jgi:hypothetical protein
MYRTGSLTRCARRRRYLFAASAEGSTEETYTISKEVFIRARARAMGRQTEATEDGLRTWAPKDPGQLPTPPREAGESDEHPACGRHCAR